MKRTVRSGVVLLGLLAVAGASSDPVSAMVPLTHSEMGAVVGRTDTRKCESFVCENSGCIEHTETRWKKRKSSGQDNYTCLGTGGNGCYYDPKQQTVCGTWEYFVDPNCLVHSNDASLTQTLDMCVDN